MPGTHEDSPQQATGYQRGGFALKIRDFQTSEEFSRRSKLRGSRPVAIESIRKHVSEVKFHDFLPPDLGLGLIREARLRPAELKVDLKEALGASRVIPLSTVMIATPIDLWAIREEVFSHRSSEAQGETIQSTLTQHEIPLPEETWTILQEMSNQLDKAGVRTAPEQLAAFIILEGISRYQRSEH